MEKAIYKVVSMRYGPEHGFYNFVNEKYEEEFSDFEDAEEVYNYCIEQAKSTDNYDYLRGDYPYDCISLSKDGEIIKQIDYEIEDSQYRDMPEEWKLDEISDLEQQSLEEYED